MSLLRGAVVLDLYVPIRLADAALLSRLAVEEDFWLNSEAFEGLLGAKAGAFLLPRMSDFPREFDLFLTDLDDLLVDNLRVFELFLEGELLRFEDLTVSLALALAPVLCCFFCTIFIKFSRIEVDLFAGFDFGSLKVFFAAELLLVGSAAVATGLVRPKFVDLGISLPIFYLLLLAKRSSREISLASFFADPV